MNMETITLSYNPASAVAMSLLESMRKSGVFKIEAQTQTQHYNPEFVAKMERAKKSEGKIIKTEDLWK